jgi:hypothetical protein
MILIRCSATSPNGDQLRRISNDSNKIRGANYEKECKSD